MRAEKEIFVDSIGQVSLVRGMIHTEYLVLREDEAGNLVKVPAVRMVVPLQGFLGSWENVQDIARQMQERGILIQSPAKTASVSVTEKRPSKKKSASRKRKKTSAGA